MSINLEDLVADMQSTDPLRQIPALGRAAKLNNELVSAAVRALTVSSARLAAADQISRFLSVSPLLEALVEQDEPDETKVFAATLLLHFGSRAGVAFLLDALRRGSGLTLHIVGALNKGRILESAPIIANILLTWDVRSDPPGAFSLVSALANLGQPLSEDIRLKIEKEAVDPYKKLLLGPQL